MSGAATDFLLAVAEPTRLRIVNCLAAAPLFVSDLQAILELPQPTVSRHLTVLRHAGIVRDTPVGQFVLYRLHRNARYERLLNAVLDGLAHEDVMIKRAPARGGAEPEPRIAPSSAGHPHDASDPRGRR